VFTGSQYDANGSVKLPYATRETDGADDVNEWWLQLRTFQF